jgi:chromosome segregation ATPase
VEEVERRALDSRAELDARRQELEEHCAALTEQLDRRTNGELSAREDASEERAQAAAALERFTTARAEADALGAELAQARSAAEEASAASARAANDLDAERTARAEASNQADVYGERLAKSEREVTEARAELAGAEQQLEQTREALAAATERLTEIESATKTLAVSEQKTRQELELLTRPDQGDGTRRPFGRSKVSAQAYKDALARIEATEAERTRAEDDAARLADRVRELESEIAAHHADPTPAEVEGDLRHLLAARQRELDEVRRELTEQRARYAAVASTMTPTELAATAEPPAGEPWTALDDDLLGRLARAKELSGSD